jgi:hypothetical protein
MRTGVQIWARIPAILADVFLRFPQFPGKFQEFTLKYTTTTSFHIITHSIIIIYFDGI